MYSPSDHKSCIPTSSPIYMILNQCNQKYDFDIYNKRDAFDFLSCILQTLTSGIQVNLFQKCFTLDYIEFSKASCCGELLYSETKQFLALSLPTNDDSSISSLIKDYFADK